jgi:CheY-like chemotaxis protein
MMNHTILVIEDNDVNMELFRDILLRIRKYRMLEAVDAETGIRLAREHHPDLILMDIELPGMDGLSASRVIKKDGELADIPIVALTSYAMSGDEEKARAAGCSGYLTKPIDIRSFLKEIDQYLR